MSKQEWYEFDLGFATKLADFLGKDMKVGRCRDVFDNIINRDHIPCESTFIILTMAYIEAGDKGSVHEAFNIYNQMVQLGGYQPSPSLQKSLFKALLHGTGGTAKHYLKQAEAIFQNMQAAGYKIKKEIYEGLVWLHSYQDCIDRERIQFLRNNMKESGIKESGDFLISILRVCSKCTDVKEAESTWAMLLNTRYKLTSHPFVYRMEVYAKAGQPMKCIEIFKDMQEKGVPMSVIAYEKIIRVLSNVQEKEYAENYMKQFEDSGLKPLQSSYVDLMQMYMSLRMYNKVESTFSRSITKCRPKWIAYDLYLESLIKCGELEKAEEVFTGLQKDSAMGVKGKTCNIMLEGYVNAGQEAKIQHLYDQMCNRKYNIDPSLMERIKHSIGMVNEDINRCLSLTLTAEQREIVTAILLSGAMLESHDKNKTFELHFEFNKKLEFCDILKTNLYAIFFEWLKSLDQLNIQVEEVSRHFSTVNHRSFRFYADHFRPGGKMAVPRLIHCWLSPRTLAYWYMYGGRKSASGYIVFYGMSYRVEECEIIAKALKAKSINCVIKRCRKLFQIRCQGKDAMRLWKLMEPYILDGLKEVLKPEDGFAEGEARTEGIDFESEDEYNNDSSSSSSDTKVQKGIEEIAIVSKMYT
ncbi:hypothetical protein SUGI_0914700 [Cryptomeria japonica]|nr:pentatricopeptide repeat-containing protein At2g15820, chloroplastic isoform X2 [Cryptomeria japonica]GLJ43880.1 hypothetical protein SUGI_0914700 [Cryptomeria japonica]